MLIRNFPGGGLNTNSYLICDEETKKAFIVDAGAYSEELAAAARRENLSLSFLILTHGHGDHIAGVKRYRSEFPEMKLVAGEDEKPLLSSPELNHAEEIAGVKVTLDADIYVRDGDVLEVGGLTLRIIATPGHTLGGISILTGGALFSGDTLFRASIGRTDLWGGSLESLKKSIKEKLFALPDDVEVYPGHMESTTIGFEKKNNPYV
ncbi:MAG: MBL fold metallo-hydrolase [Clostridiales Family XIII bacterium]|jgi:glyoxylase-like metal-dependent hydrolase (beta-lactamase superfamily II)|nr:MBL fold metallo-hydrolase [Clostridiales Family XIII bacterium]